MKFQGFSLAAGEGFEPSQTESESGVLPLHKPAIVRSPLTISQAHILLYAEMRKSQELFLFFPGFFYFYFFRVSSFFISPGFFSPVSARSTGCAFCGIGRVTALRFLRNRVSACAALSAEPGERLCCAFCGTGRAAARCLLQNCLGGCAMPSAESGRSRRDNAAGRKGARRRCCEQGMAQRFLSFSSSSRTVTAVSPAWKIRKNTPPTEMATPRDSQSMKNSRKISAAAAARKNHRNLKVNLSK